MKIEINDSEAKELLDRLAAQPESQIAEDLFNRVAMALEMQAPPQQFDHDPRFDEGGEFHEEANPHERGHRGRVGFCAKCNGDCRYDSDGDLLPTANLQPSPSLAWRTLGVAQNIVTRVADSVCGVGVVAFDKNQAYLDLQSAIGMMGAVLDGLPLREVDRGGQSMAEMEQRQQELVSQRDEAEECAAFYRAMFARARCGCIQKDCTLHGAWVPEYIGRLMAAGLHSESETSKQRKTNNQ